jgi:hypothetical protein
MLVSNERLVRQTITSITLVRGYVAIASIFCVSFGLPTLVRFGSTLWRNISRESMVFIVVVQSIPKHPQRHVLWSSGSRPLGDFFGAYIVSTCMIASKGTVGVLYGEFLQPCRRVLRVYVILNSSRTDP